MTFEVGQRVRITIPPSFRHVGIPLQTGDEGIVIKVDDDLKLWVVNFGGRHIWMAAENMEKVT